MDILSTIEVPEFCLYSHIQVIRSLHKMFSADRLCMLLLCDFFSVAQVNATDAQYVLMVAYQRGGSTFTSEIFNRNRNIFHWFEPVEPIYTAIYGTGFGNTIPLDILYERDKTLR